jgi:hypothetical protein
LIAAVPPIRRENTVSRPHHRVLSRSALLALCTAAFVSSACSKSTDEAKTSSESHEARMMSLEQVQRAMAASHPAPPVEVTPETVEVKAPDPAPAPAASTPRPRPRKATPTTGLATAAATTTTTSVALPAKSDTIAEGTTTTATASAAPTPVPLMAAPALETSRPVNLALLIDQSRIYSKDDPDVVPARLLYGQNSAAENSTITDINTMELVISKLGSVEQVKLTAPPKRMTDMLLLSGAKMWKFSPAMKNGQPVRYRTLVSYETTR